MPARTPDTTPGTQTVGEPKPQVDPVQLSDEERARISSIKEALFDARTDGLIRMHGAYSYLALRASGKGEQLMAAARLIGDDLTKFLANSGETIEGFMPFSGARAEEDDQERRVNILDDQGVKKAFIATDGYIAVRLVNPVPWFDDSRLVDRIVAGESLDSLLWNYALRFGEAAPGPAVRITSTVVPSHR